MAARFKGHRRRPGPFRCHGLEGLCAIIPTSGGDSERVQKRMRELNYQPNFAAALPGDRPDHGLGTSGPRSASSVLRGNCQGYLDGDPKTRLCLLISSSDEDPELEIEEIKQLLARRVDVISSPPRNRRWIAFA